MKQILLAAAAAFGLAACTPKPKGPQLPPATQEGKNTIGAIINGEVYSTWNDPNQNAVTCHPTCYFQEGGLNGQNITSNTCNTSVKYKNIYIYIYAPLVEGQTYQIDDGNNNSAYAECSSNISRFETDAVYTGTLTITKLTPGIISGTFQFRAKRVSTVWEDIPEVTVTEGRFDLSR